MVMDDLTSEERDTYKAKGSSNLKIAASWKRWTVMNRQQRAKFVNVLYSLSPFHAKKIADLIAADMLTSIAQIDEEVSKNRTMHEMARAMHVITDTDNIAALSKALGRYTRLELDRAHSKLDAEIEVTNCYAQGSTCWHCHPLLFHSALLQESISGWKQLTIIYNDPQVFKVPIIPHFIIVVFTMVMITGCLFACL
jgi:hypothetical protein